MPDRVAVPNPAGGPAFSAITALPSADRAPGVILLQEWWGINAHIEDLAARLAAAGFVVVAPDLYHGFVAKNADEASAAMQKLSFEEAVKEVEAAAAFLRAHPRCNGKIGVTGFCMGGALTLFSATRVRGLGAAVVFYGVPDPTKVDYAKVECPIQAHFASKDQWASVAKAEGVGEQLRANGKNFQLHVYEADHAFVNDTRKEVYHPENAKLAWGRMTTFFHEKLD